ncbi:MAG: S41 family peptidase [Anaerolineae bacterium]
MKQRPITIIAILFFTLSGFSAGYWLAQSPYAPIVTNQPGTPDEVRQEFEPFWEVWEQVQTRFYEQPVNNEALVEGAIDGMLAVLDDPHTRYLSPEEEAMARQDMRGELQGIGAEVEDVDGAITIVSPIEGSPAAAAGLQPGDILRRADGVDLTEMGLTDAVRLVRGPAGTAVTLTIERDGNLFDVVIERGVIKRDSVRAEMLPENIAYIRLTQFGENTAAELETALNDLLAQNPVGLALDLRHNPGGGLRTAVEVADQFLDEGIILTEEFGDGRTNVFRSEADGLAQEIPLVVLIDEGSASASELLAGAIQDRGRGILIGQTSFGKGTVQAWPHLSNGGGLRLTIAHWLTPDDHWIHQAGIEPDFLVAVDGENLDDDTQLQAAVDFLLGRPVIKK